jgi:hypothetical protein
MGTTVCTNASQELHFKTFPFYKAKLLNKYSYFKTPAPFKLDVLKLYKIKNLFLAKKVR